MNILFTLYRQYCMCIFYINTVSPHKQLCEVGTTVTTFLQRKN